MRFTDYLSDKWAACTLFISTGLLTGLFMASLLIKLPIIILSELPFFFVGFLLLLWDYHIRSRYYKQLTETFGELDESSYLAEVVPRPDFYDGKLLHLILKRMGKDMNDKVLNHDIELAEYKDYMETWVHEVKLPIATAKLLISNHKNEITLSIEEEIDKVDNYVEQVLYYARSENVEQDYHLEWFSLKSLVIETVKKYARNFIQANVSPQMDDLEYQVLADRKWVGFILGQLIQNSIKYRSESASIRISAEETDNHQILLSIEDNGMGIRSEDLTRVFDKGFTGSNIRNTSSATGIGLYLCRKLCLKLGLNITIDSKLSEWTKVTIYFPKGSNITKL